MRYKLLGKSGLRVSELCLGTMTFGDDWGWGAAKDESRQIFDMFVNAGGNFIDSANRYTNGTAEKLVGEFTSADREHFVITTKYTLFTRQGDPNASGNHRKNMVQALNASLKNLQTDYVDVYFVHAWDFLTPVDEVMRALDDMVRAGKVLYIAISDAPAWVISRANTLAELRGWSQFIGLQMEYSLVERGPERELILMARAMDVGLMAFSPLGGGVLTGKYNRSDPGRLGKVSERNLQLAETTMAVAEEIGCDPSQVALNWVRQQPGNIIPILGARKLSQFEENLKCLEFTLSDEHIHRLSEVSAIDLGFPLRFLSSDGIKNLVYGGTLKDIDSHRPNDLPPNFVAPVQNA